MTVTATPTTRRRKLVHRSRRLRATAVAVPPSFATTIAAVHHSTFGVRDARVGLAVAGKREGKGYIPPPHDTAPLRPAPPTWTMPAAYPSPPAGAPPGATLAAQLVAAAAITEARPQHATKTAMCGLHQWL